MFLLFLICNALTLLTTINCYVLLAANLDDFRTIAKKLVPEKLADQIVEMASAQGIKYNEPSSYRNDDESVEFVDEDSRNDGMDHSYEMTTENYKRKRIPQQSPQGTRLELKSAPGYSLDEIVEKVKERLQAELLNRDAKEKAQRLGPVAHVPIILTGVNEADLAPVYDYDKPAEVVAQIPQYDDIDEKSRVKPFAAASQFSGPLIQRQPQIQQLQQMPQANQIAAQIQQQKRIANRNKNLQLKQNRYFNQQTQGEPALANTGNKVRYLPQAQQLYQVQQIPFNPNVAQVPFNPNIAHLPLNPNIGQVPLNPNIAQMPLNLNIKQHPPRLQSAMQQQSQKLNRLAKKEKLVRNKQLIRVTKSTPTTQQEVETASDNGIFEAVDMLKSNDSYEDHEIPAKEEVFQSDVPEETVTNPTVIKLKRKVTTAAIIADEDEAMAEEIATNEAQLANGAVEYDYDRPETTTEPKAKTDSISFEEKETKSDPNATTVAEVLEKGKKARKKPKLGTIIPTREFYKLSSPNYYGKLPTVAEKYNFNEPIPEQDREPENLNPIGNPPVSINGKIALL